jgi:hypothetical protein
MIAALLTRMSGIEAVALERLLDAGAALRRAEISGEHLHLDRIG